METYLEKVGETTLQLSRTHLHIDMLAKPEVTGWLAPSTKVMSPKTTFPLSLRFEETPIIIITNVQYKDYYEHCILFAFNTQACIKKYKETRLNHVQSTENNDRIFCCSCFMMYIIDASSITGLNTSSQI